MDAAAIPLPRDETTPPVTKMYFVSADGVSGIDSHFRVCLALPRRVSPWTGNVAWEETSTHGSWPEAESTARGRKRMRDDVKFTLRKVIRAGRRCQRVRSEIPREPEDRVPSRISRVGIPGDTALENPEPNSRHEIDAPVS